MILQLRRWLPHRPLALVGDSGYAVPVSWHGAGSGPAPLLPIVGSTRYPHRPPAPGRRPLCANATPSDGPERSASAERPAAARAEGTPGPARGVMDQGAGSLVRRRHPHGGTHAANGGLVPLGQAACAPAPGLGSGPTGRIHSPGLALHRSVGGPGAGPGMVCAAPATGGHPVSSTGQALSGGAGSPGRGDPTPVAGSSHCPYYANPEGTSSPGPPWRPIFCGNNDPRPIAQRLGTPSRRRPSWTPSLWCAATCGWRPRVFHCPPPTLIYGKYRPLCTTDLSIPLLTPLELRKVQPGRPLAPAAAGRPFPTPRPTRNSQDHPNTHRKASLNESFPASRGRRIGKRRKPHRTPELWS